MVEDYGAIRKEEGDNRERIFPRARLSEGGHRGPRRLGTGQRGTRDGYDPTAGDLKASYTYLCLNIYMNEEIETYTKLARMLCKPVSKRPLTRRLADVENLTTKNCVSKSPPGRHRGLRQHRTNRQRKVITDEELLYHTRALSSPLVLRKEGGYDRVGLGWAAEASSGEDPSFGGVSGIFMEKRR